MSGLKKELVRFLIVGGIAVAIDGFSYWLFMQLGWMEASWSKRASFALGSIWAFFMNKYFTFGQKALRMSEPFLFTFVYLAGWFLNSVAHDLVLHWFGVKPFAFLVATGLSTCTNFIGQKWIVFRKTHPKS